MPDRYEKNWEKLLSELNSIENVYHLVISIHKKYTIFNDPNIIIYRMPITMSKNHLKISTDNFKIGYNGRGDFNTKGIAKKLHKNYKKLSKDIQKSLPY